MDRRQSNKVSLNVLFLIVTQIDFLLTEERKQISRNVQGYVISCFYLVYRYCYS